MYTTPLPPIEYLQECFEYKDDGSLLWKYRPIRHFGCMDVASRFNGAHFREVAGSVNDDGYLKIGLTYKGKAKVYSAHRIIWAMHNYPIPDGLLVDHKNGNTLDNRISNLRLATDSENACNSWLSSANTSGVKGVSFYKRLGLWVAQVCKEKTNHRIGLYKELEEAQAAVEEARLQLHGVFANNGE